MMLISSSLIAILCFTNPFPFFFNVVEKLLKTLDEQAKSSCIDDVRFTFLDEMALEPQTDCLHGLLVVQFTILLAWSTIELPDNISQARMRQCSYCCQIRTNKLKIILKNLHRVLHLFLITLTIGGIQNRLQFFIINEMKS